jgi:hypothetical protein
VKSWKIGWARRGDYAFTDPGAVVSRASGDDGSGRRAGEIDPRGRRCGIGRSGRSVPPLIVIVVVSVIVAFVPIIVPVGSINWSNAAIIIWAVITVIIGVIVIAAFGHAA